MSSFQKQIYENECRRAVVEHYQQAVRDTLLERLVMPSTDTEIEGLCRELADELHIGFGEAMALLQPVTRAIYHGAKCHAEEVLKPHLNADLQGVDDVDVAGQIDHPTTDVQKTTPGAAFDHSLQRGAALIQGSGGTVVRKPVSVATGSRASVLAPEISHMCEVADG